MTRWRPALYLALCLALLPAVNSAQGQTPVRGPSSISGAIFAEVLQAWRSPLAEHASAIYAHCQARGVDCAFALAVWRKDSSMGTAGASVANRNPGNLICAAAAHPPATGCNGRWAVYPDWGAAGLDWVDYIVRRYFDRGLTTVEQIIPVYAPGFENNVPQYIAQVNQWMREWGSGVVGSAPGNGGILQGVINMEWLTRPRDELIYGALRILTSIIWWMLSGVFWLVDLIERLRMALITGGFRPVIDSLTGNLLLLVPASLALGLLAGLIFVLLQPLLRAAPINFRRWVLLAATLGLLLPAASGIFQSLEEARANVGGVLYETAVTASAGTVSGLAGTSGSSGQAQEIGPVVPFNPGVTGLHGVDIAAAYLLATRQDVIDPAATEPADLPDGFAERFYPLTMDEFANADAAQRWDAILLAGTGVGRMLSGLILVGFALCEAGMNLIFTLGLGMLILALAISLVFGYWRPIEHLSNALVQQVIEVFMASWAISVLNGLLMALMLVIAQSMSAVAVFGAGLLGLVLTYRFLKTAFRSVQGGVDGALHAASGGTVDLNLAQSAQQARQLALGAAGMAFTGGTGAYTGITRPLGAAAGAVGTAGSMAGAYRQAARAGHSRLTSATYAAASQSSRFARAGALATAMRYEKSPRIRDDIEPGLWLAQRTRGDGIDIRAQRILRKSGADAKKRRDEAAQSGGQP